MSVRRVGMDRLQEMVRLHRMGSGHREIARLLKMGPNTERQYRKALQAAGLLDGTVDALPAIEELKAAVERHAPLAEPPRQTSSVEAWSEQVAALVTKKLGPRAIYDRLRLEDERFTGSLSAIKRLCRRLQRERGVQPEDVAIPVETAPGEIAQVDFGYVGRLFDPQTMTLRRAWAFVMVLAYSRHMFVRVVFDQTVTTWLRVHAEAFAALGGVIETVAPDNLKSAVIRAAFGIDGPTALNRSYREFAHHYGFKIDPTPVYDPRKKGKVESAVKYVKGNFFRGREQADVEALRPDLQRWVREIAGRREHGTTGKQPLVVFETLEQPALKPLPAVPFEPITWKEATVHRDSHVIFERRLYSVPWRLIGKKVWVRATNGTVAVYWDDTRVATHSTRGPGHRSTDDAHLPEHRADLRHRSRSYWEQRAERMGTEVADYVRDVFDSDEVLSMLRVVQAIVTHLERHPPHRARAACIRARYYGSHSYQAIKNILSRALDLEPLPTATAPAASPLESPRFARRPAELLQLPLEDDHEPN